MKRSRYRVHPSHRMTKWKSTIVTLSDTSRFGRFRKCSKCEAEQARTVAGEACNQELLVKCPVRRQG